MHTNAKATCAGMVGLVDFPPPENSLHVLVLVLIHILKLKENNAGKAALSVKEIKKHITVIRVDLSYCIAQLKRSVTEICPKPLIPLYIELFKYYKTV